MEAGTEPDARVPARTRDRGRGVTASLRIGPRGEAVVILVDGAAVPCFAGETVAAARIADDPDEGRRAAGQWTGRAPLRPVVMDDLAGRFDYGEIPIPAPAPL